MNANHSKKIKLIAVFSIAPLSPCLIRDKETIKNLCIG